MADFVQPLLNGVSPASASTFYSDAFDTKDFRDFAFKLRMPTTGSTTSGTVDFYIEASSESDFSNAYKIMVLTLTDSNTAISTSFTQVPYDTTLPADTITSTVLRQLWNVKDVNVDRYIRVKYVVAAVHTNFTGIIVDLLANRKV
tara:strand:+ start:1497 stop:1931 length:435 start_codon:yes stop_codon:yes gene_type:complete